MFTSRVASHSISRSQSRHFSSSIRHNADFTHAVIGGGVVGLAIARKLQSRDSSSTVLIEKHSSVGTETSSRNSEVIHAGLYYGPDSLKTQLCIKGKQQLYDLCQKHNIPHRKTGKWIVAQDSEQMSAIEKVHTHAQTIGVPTHFLSKKEAQTLEPDVRAEAGVLSSPTTGIIDSHSLMQYLQGSFEDAGGICAFHSPVTSISAPTATDPDWHIGTTDASTGERGEITSSTIINAAGLYAIPISNMILHENRISYYAKGSYFSYALSHPRPKTLIYPAPIPGHGGLGTHLTLDLSGRIRFGPDVEWIDDPADYTPNKRNIDLAIRDIQSYLPGVRREDVSVDYAGIRPKLGRPPSTAGQGYFDFWIKKEVVRRDGGEGVCVNLLGIESPGLTSCLAIGDVVEGLLYR